MGIFLNATSISVIYFILKYLESQFLQKPESKLTFQDILKNTVFTFLVSCIGLFIIEQINQGMPKINQEGGSNIFSEDNIPVFSD